MSDKKYKIVTEILTNSASFKNGMRESQNIVRRFSTSARNDIESIKRAWNSWTGKLAAVGLGFGGFKVIKEAAAIDKKLSGIGVSAGKTKEEISSLRGQLEGLALKTGQKVNELADGFKRIYSLTGSWDVARKAISAVNVAVKTTGANTDLLAESLAVAQTSFGIDLNKPGMAQSVLNRLAGAGRGAGGMENVAGIFNFISPMAQLSGMNFDDAITLISTVSQITKNPEQMGTYADQTLRLFTNLKSMTNKKSRLGKLLFDENDRRRDPLEILQELKKLYDGLGEKKQIGLLTALTGGGDAKSLRTVQMLLSSGALKNIKSSPAADLEKRLPEVLNNAEDQAARLKELLGQAGNKFAEPINKALVNIIQFGIDKAVPESQRMGLSGKDVAIGGSIAFLTAVLGGKYFKGALGNFLGGKTGLLPGIAEGKALQAAAGVTPVYVVNFSEVKGFGGQMGAGPAQSVLKKIPAVAAAGSLAAPILATALIGGGLYGAYRINQEYIKNRGTFKPRELYDDEKYPLFYGKDYHVDSFNENGIRIPKTENNITIFIDGEKKKPSKTIIDNRGRF